MGEDGNRLWALFEKRLAFREGIARAVIHTFLQSPCDEIVKNAAVPSRAARAFNPQPISHSRFGHSVARPRGHFLMNSAITLPS